VPDLEQEDFSLYTNSLQNNKHGEHADNLDDSLCEDDGGKEKEHFVPSMEDLTQVTSSGNNANQLIDGEKNCNLVDELFDGLPMVPQNTNNSDNNIVSENFDKKIAPLFSSAKKKKRFRAPVQSITDENACKQTNKGKTTQTNDTKTQKTKPVFKAGTKSSTAKKRKLFEVSKDENEKVSEPPMKELKSDTDEKQKSCEPIINDEVKEVEFNAKGGMVTSSDDLVKASSITNKEVSPVVEAKKKKGKKKANEEETTNDGSIKKAKKVTGSKKGADASKKKAAQQQAKIDMSCKNLDREQRKAEKELQKISRDLEKARKQKSNKEKQSVKINQPSTSSSSGQLWVQCDQPDCLKWRRLRDCKNSSEIPEKWFCSMNPGEYFIDNGSDQCIMHRSAIQLLYNSRGRQ